METISIELLTKKLKNAPQSVLERVIGYVDALIEPTNTKPYSLSNEQQQILDSQLNSDKATYTNAETLYTDLKKKYELLGLLFRPLLPKTLKMLLNITFTKQ
jgi:hypothetical protein